MEAFEPPKNVDETENALQALDEFIDRTSEPMTLKRALAVRMWIKGIETKKIQDVLGVSAAFISKWKVRFAMEGVEGLRLKYQGSKGFLDSDERREVIEWLQSKNDWMLEELEAYIEEKYGVQFKSRTSYYELFKESGISWKKTQKKNPKKNEEEGERLTFP
ncbi:MAG: winged helix-turn-helix domain-containing protein [Cyanobacteriota bacterium]|nr:winged helix-turn-helix domain-containing protein [Cyanobacteriota bacterium]